MHSLTCHCRTFHHSIESSTHAKQAQPDKFDIHTCKHLVAQARGRPIWLRCPQLASVLQGVCSVVQAECNLQAATRTMSNEQSACNVRMSTPTVDTVLSGSHFYAASDHGSTSSGSFCRSNCGVLRNEGAENTDLMWHPRQGLRPSHWGPKGGRGG